MTSSPADEEFELPLGTRLQRRDQDATYYYVLESELGEGAFGLVYKARREKISASSDTTQETTPLQVALKIFRGDDYEDYYKDEVANLMKIKETCHQGACLLRIVDHFKDSSHHDCCCVVTWPPARIDLKRLLEEEPDSYSFDDIVRWGQQMATAVYSLHHDAGLYHGDICPRNVLITEGGEYAILADYGISTRHHRHGNRLDELAGRKIRSACLAPEMVGSSGEFNLAADLWGFGVVIDALLSKSVSRCSEDIDMRRMHNYFLGFHEADGSSSKSCKEWMEEIVKCWASTSEEGRVTRLATVVMGCLRKADNRMKLPTVMAALEALAVPDYGAASQPSPDLVAQMTLLVDTRLKPQVLSGVWDGPK